MHVCASLTEANDREEHFHEDLLEGIEDVLCRFREVVFL